MKNREHLTFAETLHPAEQGTVASTFPKTEDVSALLTKRKSMLDRIRNRLSPLMQRALEIKLSSEEAEWTTLIATEEKAVEERRKKQGVLDSQYFRKRRLPARTI